LHSGRDRENAKGERTEKKKEEKSGDKEKLGGRVARYHAKVKEGGTDKRGMRGGWRPKPTESYWHGLRASEDRHLQGGQSLSRRGSAEKRTRKI